MVFIYFTSTTQKDKAGFVNEIDAYLNIFFCN